MANTKPDGLPNIIQRNGVTYIRAKGEYETLANELPTAYVTDEDGNNLYVWSHVQVIRYNEAMTLEEKLLSLEDLIGEGGGGGSTAITAEAIYAALGYYPVNPNTEVTFGDKVTINDQLAFGEGEFSSLFKPLYDTDGTTVIGHILE